MFYILSKLFAFLIMPMSWVVGLLALAYFVKGKAARVCVTLGLALSLLLSSPLVTGWVYDRWCAKEWSPLEEMETFEYAIIAGGFSDYNMDADQWDVNRAGDRMIEAVRLYRRGVVNKILVTGDAASNNLNGSNSSQRFVCVMEELGVAPSDLIIEKKALNTRENAVFTKELLPDTIVGGQCLLITSAFHGYRTKRCYDKVGLRCRLYVVDIPTSDRVVVWRDFLPDWSQLDKWNELMHEWIGVISYRFVGYI